MDIHRMKLFNGQVKNVGSIDKSAYELDPESTEKLPGLLEQLIKLEYWNPVFQAWQPFFNTYLKCGCNPSLMSRYGKQFLSKEDYLIPPPCAYSDIFSNILRLRNTREDTVFDDYMYSDIKRLCDTELTFYLQNRKAIKKQLFQPAMYDVTLRQLLGNGSWGRTIRAIYLLRHCQLDDFKASMDIIVEIKSRLQDWIDVFNSTFEEITAFVSGNSEAYKWYCQDVMRIVDRVWDSSLLVEDRPRLLTPVDTDGMTVVVRDLLVSYVNTHPLVDDNPFYNQTVWDCLCNVFFATDVDDPNFIDKSFYVLCIPGSYIDRVVDIIFDFYWIVKRNDLTNRLYTLKVNAVSSGDSGESPESYLQGLYMRGFPEIGKE